MSTDFVAAAKELSDKLKERAAVQPSSVSVSVKNDELVARCRVQPEGDPDIAEIIKQIERKYSLKVDYARL